MNLYVLFSAILTAASVMAYAFYQLWQGGFAGSNYMKNEYNITSHDDEGKNDDDYYE